MVRKSSASRSGPGRVVVPVDQGRHQGSLGSAARSATASRIDARTAADAAPPHVRRGRPTSGGPRAASDRGQVVVVGGASRPVARDPAAQRDVAPRVVADQQHRRRECVAAAAPRRPPAPRPAPSPVAVPALDRTRVGGDRALDPHRHPLGGERRHRAAARPASTRSACSRPRPPPAPARAAGAVRAAPARDPAAQPSRPRARHRDRPRRRRPPSHAPGARHPPRPRAAAARHPQVGHRARRSSPRSDRTSHRHQRSELGERRLADAVDLEQLVDRGEAAVLVAPGEDRLRGHRTDAGQRLELGGRRC